MLPPTDYKELHEKCFGSSLPQNLAGVKEGEEEEEEEDGEEKKA
jgi:hypothetical protein